MFAASQSAMLLVADQQPVSTSSPPRWIMFLGNRPEGLPLAVAWPPVISPSSASMRVKVALLATFKGWLHCTDGQMSG